MIRYEKIQHEFAPIFDGSSRVLVLGTFPSVKSREAGFYYGHPQNRFWKVMAGLTGEDVPQSIKEKKDLLISHGIALWDVVESCTITGSSDSSIRDVVPNDLERILVRCGIQRIYANGTTARKLFDQYQRERCGREIIGLPSTSPANAAFSLTRLLESWSVMKPFLLG